MRASIATLGSASVTAGRTRWDGEPAPPTGSQLSHSENTTMSTSPVQKIGIESPKSEPSRASASKSELGHTADVVHVADGERLVEPQMLAEPGHGLLGRVLAEHERDGVARQQVDREHDDEDDAEQDRHG